MTHSLSREWDAFWNQVESGNVRLSLSTVQRTVELIRRNLTRITTGETTTLNTSHLLDNEWIYDASVEVTDEHSKVSVTNSETVVQPTFNSYAGAGPSSSQQLFLNYKKRVGRASIFRERAQYFVLSDDPVTPEEADARHQRGEEANHRKACRAAADEAMAGNCNLWATLTFDDQHRSVDPQEQFEAYKRRLRERYKRQTGNALKYVAVIGFSESGREHVHMLMSDDVDPDDVRECWPYGHIDEIWLIEHEEIETKIGYMGDHVRDGRVTFGRFLRSRSSYDPDELIPIRDVAEGREILEELVFPHRVRIVQSRLFGQFTRINYRFFPIRDDEEFESEDD
jgi:hypothetical protein